MQGHAFRRSPLAQILAVVLVATASGCGGAGGPTAGPHRTVATPSVAPARPVEPSDTRTPAPAPATPSPSADRWEPAGDMAVARGGFDAVLLLDGRVLAVGNDNDCMPGGAPGDSAQAEIFDPSTGRWSATGSLNKPRDGFAAVRLLDGRVLVAGGRSGWQDGGPLPYSSTKLYDPTSSAWSSSGLLDTARAYQAATLLADGRVLIAGGVYWSGGPLRELATAEVFDPATGAWTPTGRLASPRVRGTAYTLPDGRVALFGGDESTLRSIELYDPVAGTWRVAGNLPPGAGHVTAVLADGSILFAGGYPAGQASDAQPLDAAWRFDPDTGVVTQLASMPSPRAGAAVAVLADGRVLLAGGREALVDGDEPYVLTSSTVLYDPATDRWSPTAPMPTAVEHGQAVTLRDGSVLVAGGVADWGQPSTPWCPETTAHTAIFVPAVPAAAAAPTPPPAPIAAPSLAPGAASGAAASAASRISWQRVPGDVALVGGATRGLRLQDLAVTPDGYIAVGGDVRGGVILTSSDGVEWTRSDDNASLDNAMLAAVAPGPGLTIAIRRTAGSNRNLLWTSTDGRSWQAVDRAFARNVGVVDAAASADRFVVAGSVKLEADASGSRRTVGAVWTSSNGRSWSRIELPRASLAGDIRPTSVAYLASRFVVLGRASGEGSPAGMLVWTSANGRTWRRGLDIEVPADGSISALAVAPDGRLVAVGAWASTQPSRSAVFTSTDGLRWTRVPDQAVFDGAIMRGLACDAARCVAVGDTPGSEPSGAVTWTSTDGLVWERTSLTQDGNGIGMDQLVLTPQGALALGWTVTPWRDRQYVDRATLWVTPPTVLPAPRPAPAVPTIEGRWETLPPLSVPRGDPAVAVGRDGRIYVFGGSTRATGATRTVQATSVEILDPETRTWAFGATIPAPVTRRAAAVTASDGCIYLFHQGSSRVLVYDPARDTWRRGPSVPSGRFVSGALAGPGRLITLMTWDRGSSSPRLDTLDPGTGRWRSGATATYLPVAWGPDGLGYAVSSWRAWSIDPATGAAIPRAAIPVLAHGSAGPGPGGLIWLVGYTYLDPSGARSSETFSAAVQAYDPATNTWAVAPPPEPPSWMSSIVGIDNRLYVIGGSISSTVSSALVLVVDQTRRPGG